MEMQTILARKLGKQKADILMMNILKLEKFCETTMKNISIGTNRDNLLFKNFKKMLINTNLCLKAFNKNRNFTEFYELFKENLQALYDSADNYQSKQNKPEVEIVIIGNVLKLGYDLIQYLNKLYAEVNNNNDSNEISKIYDELCFYKTNEHMSSIPIKA